MFDGIDLLAASERRADRHPPPQDGDGVPAFRAAAAPDRARQRRLPAEDPGRRQATSGERARRGSDRTRRPQGPRAPLSARTLRRPAAARRHRPHAGGEAAIWFLDEPFSALDPLIRREMQEELMRLQRMLNKTIVFITHDFDEAIRLADRLAIMKDGVVIQLGTPEEIIANPATDYVAAFTRDAPKGKVLTARSIMSPLLEGEQVFHASVPASTRIAAIAGAAFDGMRPLGVTDDSGKLIGSVAGRDVAAVLAGTVEEAAR